MPIKFGLIGFGNFGNQLATALGKVRGAELAAISAHTDISCKKAKQQFAVDTYIDYTELLKRDDIDVVHIATPNHLHRKMAVDALNYGKHVLLEKPMANTVKDCNAILKAAEANKRILRIGFELRFSAQCKKIKELIERGKIGTPKMGIIELWRGPYRSGRDGWRYDPARVGNWLLEQPVHLVDLACWYMRKSGTPISVCARANSVSKTSSGLTENMSFFINYHDAGYVVVNQTLAAYNSKQSIKFVGTKGTLEAVWASEYDAINEQGFTLQHFNGKKVSTVAINQKAVEKDILQSEITQMVREINTNAKTDLATGIDGKISVAICLAADKSARLNKTVPINNTLR